MAMDSACWLRRVAFVAAVLALPSVLAQSLSNGTSTSANTTGGANSTTPPNSAYFTVVGPCTINGACVRSPNYPSNYGSSQSCTITPMSLTVGQLLNTIAFNTESSYDKLIVNGATYTGTTGPSGEVLGSAFTWSSDYTTQGGGWEVCAAPPGTSMTSGATTSTTTTAGTTSTTTTTAAATTGGAAFMASVSTTRMTTTSTMPPLTNVAQPMTTTANDHASSLPSTILNVFIIVLVAGCLGMCLKRHCPTGLPTAQQVPIVGAVLGKRTDNYNGGFNGFREL